MITTIILGHHYHDSYKNNISKKNLNPHKKSHLTASMMSSGMSSMGLIRQIPQLASVSWGNFIFLSGSRLMIEVSLKFTISNSFLLIYLNESSQFLIDFFWPEEEKNASGARDSMSSLPCTWAQLVNLFKMMMMTIMRTIMMMMMMRIMISPPCTWAQLVNLVKMMMIYL